MCEVAHKNTLSLSHTHTCTRTQEYLNAKDTIIRYERELLRAFGFIVHAEHPHNFVINYVRLLEGGQEFTQLAWNILNDR